MPEHCHNYRAKLSFPRLTWFQHCIQLQRREPASVLVFFAKLQIDDMAICLSIGNIDQFLSCDQDDDVAKVAVWNNPFPQSRIRIDKSKVGLH